MITAQDIREKTFEKSKFGGYDMAEVDEFLEELADDLTSAQKETAVLKSKMKILVDKIEEYRSNESALNQSILSAQKLAQQIESDARAKAEKMLSEAEQTVQEKIGTIAEKTAFEEKRLSAAQAASAKFIEGIRAICNAQLKNIDTIESTELAPSAAPASMQEAPKAQRPAQANIDDTVHRIDASVSRIKPEASAPMDLDLKTKVSTPRPAKDADSTQPFSI